MIGCEQALMIMLLRLLTRTCHTASFIEVAANKTDLRCGLHTCLMAFQASKIEIYDFLLITLRSRLLARTSPAVLLSTMALQLSMLTLERKR